MYDKNQYEIIISSLKKKIEKYELPEIAEDIPLSGNLVRTTYNDGTTEVVDQTAEFYLCKKYFLYFADNYGLYKDQKNKRIYAFKSYDFQRKLVVPGFLNYRFVIFRKCLTENNYIQTDRGYISIKDIKVGDKVLTLNENNNYVWDYVTDWWKNKEQKEIVRIKLKNGSQHESTLDHKWYTQRGWVEAKNLTIDDELVTDFGNNNFGNYELPSDDYAKLIGYMLTDGRNGTEFINTNLEYINEAVECGKHFKDINPWIRERSWCKLTKKQSYEARFVSNHGNNKTTSFQKFSEKYGLNQLSVNRKFTPDLMNLNKRQLSILLNRLYAGDGWATKGFRKGPNDKNYIKFSIGFVTPNKDMIFQLQEILRKYGIQSYIKIRKAGRKRSTIDTYLLYVTGKESALKFAKEIGIKGKIDQEYINFLEKNYIYEKQTFHSKIRKIKKIGLQETYDITTKDTHTFLTNGSKSHNCRQVGISVISGIYAVWVVNFNIAQEILIVSKTKVDAQKFKAKAMLTYDALPSFLKCKATRDGQNLTTLKLTNSSELVVRAQSPDAGRGGTWSLVILDEAAFMPYAEEIWDSVFPALSESNGRAIVISTSNGVGNWYHKKWIEAEEGNNDFHPLYVPWWKSPGRSNPWLEKIEKNDFNWIAKELGDIKCKEIKTKITKDELDPSYFVLYNKRLLNEFIEKKENEALTYQGPIEEKPWLKLQYDNSSSPRKFYQEILARFLGSGNTVISSEALERIKHQILDPLFKDALNKDTPIKGLNIFQTPQEGITYTLFADVMSGCGTDYSTFIIFRDDTLEQVAEYKNQLDTKLFAQTIKKVAIAFHHAYVVVETNQGMSVFNELFLNDNNPYENMYYEFKNKAYRGLHTGPANKKLMIDEFMYNIDNDVIKIYGKRTLDELEVFTWQENGKPAASKGYNDDLVLPIMFLSYLIKYGNQKTKSLGFATSDQTIGREQEWESDEETERKYNDEQYAREMIQDNFGIDFDTYSEFTR